MYILDEIGNFRHKCSPMYVKYSVGHYLMPFVVHHYTCSVKNVLDICWASSVLCGEIKTKKYLVWHVLSLIWWVLRWTLCDWKFVKVYFVIPVCSFRTRFKIQNTNTQFTFDLIYCFTFFHRLRVIHTFKVSTFWTSKLIIICKNKFVCKQ